MTSSPSEFVAALERQVTDAMSSLAGVRDDTVSPTGDEARGEVIRRLEMALQNELEASQLAALWMPSTPELDVKLGLARQAGDEARHYGLIAEHMEGLGVDLSGFDPTAGGPSPMYRLLEQFESTVERVAAAQFTRESLALTKNEQFIDFCETVGAASTAVFYRERIQPDERWHVDLGKRTLERYALTGEQQDRAREAAGKVLDLAKAIQKKQVHEMGVSHAPGC
jgi:1,2-phenylacetyl-CoA epoxidase catalytic subunit